MGRPRKNVEETASADSNSEYLDASFILDNPKKIISVSPALDIVLSGGIPESTVAIFKADPKIGKTTLALKVAAKGQKQFGKKVIYINVENRLSKKNLEGVKGLDISPEMFKIISSEKGNILSAEQILEKTEKALIDFPESIFIFDSFSSLSGAAEKTNKYGEGYGNLDVRKMEGTFARRTSPIVMVNNSIILGIAHVSPNISMPGKSTSIGKKTVYAMDLELSLKKVYPQGDWTAGDRLVGQKIQIDCLTSALGPPGQSCVCWLKYGEGYSDEAELAQLAIDLSLIEKKGAGWMEIEKFGLKAQGMDNMVTLLEQRSDVFDYLNDQVKEMVK
jgi:recombination protein RecA